MTPKPIMIIDPNDFVEWYFDKDTCECERLIQGETIQDVLNSVGYIPTRIILNLEDIEKLDDVKIKDEEIEQPGDIFQMIFQEYYKEE